MRFETWPFLFLLLLIPLLHRWWKQRNRPAKVAFSLPIPTTVSVNSPLFWLLLIRYLGLGLLIIALARPQLGHRQTERQRFQRAKT